MRTGGNSAAQSLPFTVVTPSDEPPIMPDPTDAATTFLGWEAMDLPLLLLLPFLLLISAFFSGSETALFSMTGTERMQLRRSGSIVSRAVEALLSDQRMLLITVLLGNMTVNVLYFVISSVLTMRAEVGVAGGLMLALLTLLAIVLLGEVLPKMLANSKRLVFVSLIAPPLFTLHRLITPLRLVLDALIVTPLSRLTAPSEAPPVLSEDELRTLLEISGEQGVIDAEEQRILLDVISLSRLKVRDVMTPRVRMVAVPIHATPDQVRELARESGHGKLPVYRGDVDEIIGLLPVKRFLLAARDRRIAVRRIMDPPRFVPLHASLEQVLEQFRKWKSRTAIVVDEFGGTAGLITLEDVIERLVGDLVSNEEPDVDPPRRLSPTCWEVDGDMSVHDWAEAFGYAAGMPHVSTVGGLIIDRLGRAPNVGDRVALGNLELEVLEVDRVRVQRAKLTLHPHTIDIEHRSTDSSGGRGAR